MRKDPKENVIFEWKRPGVPVEVVTARVVVYHTKVYYKQMIFGVEESPNALVAEQAQHYWEEKALSGWVPLGE